jgi:GNAT superfamily N-acetyltransferase
MQGCSVCENLQIMPGCLDDYRRLAGYHYCGGHTGPASAIFVLSRPGCKMPVGVIVYSNAPVVLELRNVATGHIFAGLDRSTQLELINANIRRISRVIVEPRFRGLGLASWLVRETMPLLNVPIIEAIAVMGWVNPFFEKAGMKAYKAQPSAASVQFIEALSFIGIEQAELLDPELVQHKFDKLNDSQAQFIEHQVRHFLKNHGRRRDMPPGLERTRYILTKLTARPVYYIWFNPKFTKEDKSCEKLKTRIG